MVGPAKRKNPDHAILWDEISIAPAIQLKTGILRKTVPLERQVTGRRGHLTCRNEFVELKGRWEELEENGSTLALKLTNVSSESIRITRLTFPTENGLNAFLGEFDPNNISFMRNGYQSWSTARSYRVREKPLRPWLLLVSRASSNLANLPSNHPGILSSEMYSVIADNKQGQSFLIGQGASFRQFFYIKLNLYRAKSRASHVELQYDFGRKMVEPGESIELDLIVMMKGMTHSIVTRYFEHLKRQMKISIPAAPYRGWCSWYYYYNKITPDIILRNLEAIRRHRLDIDFIQIDDGYQRRVGDWLDLNEPFAGRMRELTDAIKDAGYQPGLWLAPFAAERNSELFRLHPEYLFRSEYGRRIVAGYAPFWKGHLYYGLDVTNPRFAEYLRKVIRTMVHDWGFTYLKCDFMFAGALREAESKDITLSRAEILRRGMQIIREGAERDVIIVGCGMPLSTGIGVVDAMRIGPDTGPYWIERPKKLLRTGAMVGVRNSVRNFMVRSYMNKNLWLNDPDCLMLRQKKTSLSPRERMTQINAIILSGGLLLYSDDFTRIPDELMAEIRTINRLNAECFQGSAIPVDMMEREMPEIYYNTSGYLGIFNHGERTATKSFMLDALPVEPLQPISYPLVDVWSGEAIPVRADSAVVIERMAPHSSVLLSLKGPIG